MNLSSILTSRLQIICNDSLDKYFEICGCVSEAGELHHILPKSLFPEYENLKEHPFNGVVLSVRMHVLAHYYFSLATGTLWRCVGYMLGTRRDDLSSDEIMDLIDQIRYETRCLAHTEESKEKMRKPKNWSNETRTKMSEKARKQMSDIDPELRGMMDVARQKTIRSSEGWKNYDELYVLWTRSNFPKYKVFRKICVDSGLPDVYYGSMIKQFIKDHGGKPKTTVMDFYDEIHSIWSANGKPGEYKLKRLCVEAGLPDGSYEKTLVKLRKNDIHDFC